MLDPDVLDVDAGRAGRREQPGQLAGLVGDDHLDHGELARRTAVLAGDPGHARLAAVEQAPRPIWRPSPSASIRAASARSAATAASTSATGAALADRIWVHRPVSPAAILVTSRSPCPARSSASRGAASRRAAMAAATRCGACEISATHRSWAAGSVRTGTAPHARTRAVTACRAASEVSGSGHRAQVRPRNRSARAAARAVLLPSGQRVAGD